MVGAGAAVLKVIPVMLGAVAKLLGMIPVILSDVLDVICLGASKVSRASGLGVLGAG